MSSRMEQWIYDLMVSRAMNLIRIDKEKSYDSSDYIFVCSREIGRNESYIHISSRIAVCSDKQISNCGFWVHELSELTITGILKRWQKSYLKDIRFKGFKYTTVSHFISPCGLNNKRSLNPQLRQKEPAW